MNGNPTWVEVATQKSIVKRACFYALIVGTILISINHGDAILAGEVTGTRLIKMGLTMMVPYMVSTCSSVGAIRDRA